MDTTTSLQNQDNSAGGLKKSTIDALVKNYQHRIKLMRKSSGKVEDYDPSRDSKSIWFSKKAIDQLFKVNGCTEENGGLRMYFGVHDKEIMPTDYDDQLTVVLVATKLVNGIVTDQLNDDKGTILPETDGTWSSGSGSGINGTDPGTGLNHGALCPPNC